jgi:hypothetical protein
MPFIGLPPAFMLAHAISGKARAALAAFFFNIHTVNAYTTYDLGFCPSCSTGCFMSCLFAYLRYVRTEQIRLSRR